MKVKNFGLKKEFYDRYNPEELLHEVYMTPEQIVFCLKSMEKLMGLDK
jgi:1-deoxy-D-xylulose-5-phosphate synthase